MTVRELVCNSDTPVTIIDASTGKIIKRNVTTETLRDLGTLHVVGVQSTFTVNNQLVCWVN